MAAFEKLKSVWVSTRIVLAKDESGRTAALMIPATVCAYFLAQWWGAMGWMLFVGCCAGLAMTLVFPWLLFQQCPACKHRTLRGRPDKRIVEAMHEGVRANPAWLWCECIGCGARFKTPHYGDGVLQNVDDDEWNASVLSKPKGTS
jgi:hypothetical protein